MSSITTWNRIESRTRDRSLPGLEARVADPLWLLGRQWQVGEFQGEDAGSPAVARLRATVGQLTRFAPGEPTGSITGQPYDATATPLETVVEAEPALEPGESNVRLAAEAGLVFWRELDAVGLSFRREDYLLDWCIERPTREERAGLDDATARFVDTVAERVPDGVALRDAIKAVRAAGGDLPATPRYDEHAERKLANKAADAFLAWWDALDAGAAPGSSDSCWASDRLEYRFATSAKVGAQEVVLQAPEYRGHNLDWAQFDLDSQGSVSLMKGVTDSGSTSIDKSTMPVPADYRGMPSPRWWEFEDADVHFGGVDAATVDLTRMLFMEFALIYGNDFFVIPLSLEVGSVCMTQDVEVVDTFGGVWRIPSIDEVDGTGGQFHLFKLEGATAGRSPFVLAPSLVKSLTGPPLEEVGYARDDLANMAWAVERIVLGPDGRPARRLESERERRQRELQAAIEAGTAENKRSDDPLHYRIIERPPESWLPLVPVKSGVDQIDLQVRALLDDEHPPQPILPLGRIVTNGDVIKEEEVPRKGLTITRAYQYARWRGGSSQLWIGRERGWGQDEGSSGLRFDVAE